MTHGLNNHPRTKEQRAAFWRAFGWLALGAAAVAIVIAFAFHALVWSGVTG